MPRARPSLEVWLYGTRVATLEDRYPRDVRCTYTTEALERWPGNTPLLSCSLPLRPRPQEAGVFFSGLLPEGTQRLTLAAAAKVPSGDVFGLLARFGRDVAGAMIVSAEEPEASRWGVETYTDESLAAEILGLPEHPLGVHDDSELSLAGVQNKLLLVDAGNGTWGRPLYGSPSTHILKVGDDRFPGLVDAEAACLRLAGAVDLTSVTAELLDIADARCLIVSRYDRRRQPDGQVERIHQEDACQALGRDPEPNGGRGKYEAYGGPALRDVAGLLGAWADDRAAQLDRLVSTTAFTVLIGNSDAHAKNVSLLHTAPGTIELAPLYDTVPTVLWPKLPTRAAMTINARRDLGLVTLDDVAAEASRWGHDSERARRVAVDTAVRVKAAVEDGVIDPGTPLGEFIAERVRRLLDLAARPADSIMDEPDRAARRGERTSS